MHVLWVMKHGRMLHVEGRCGEGEVCKTGTGECTQKTQDIGCSMDSECSDEFGDDYECNEDEGFCYFDECENDGDCTDYGQGTTFTYICSEKNDGEVNGVYYNYGVCEVDPTGVDQSGLLDYLNIMHDNVYYYYYY